jgi:hypothetical protein
LIDLLVLGDARVEVLWGLFFWFALVVQTVDFDFFYVLGDDVFVVADALDPDQLVFLFHVRL